MTKAEKQKKTILMGCAAAIVVLLVAAVFVMKILMEKTSADNSLSVLQDIAKSEAKNVSAQLDLLISDMRDTAKRFEIIEAVSYKGNNEFRLTELSDRILQNQRYAIQVELIPYGKSENYPLSFAELEQVKQIEKGKNVPVEAILGVEKKWHFIITVPIWNKTKDTVEGSLFMSYKLDRIKLAMEAFDHSNGSSSLVQTFEGLEPRTIFTIGDYKPVIDETNMVNIPNSRWQILITPSPEIRNQSKATPSTLMGILTALGIAIAGIIIFLLRSVKFSTGSAILDSDILSSAPGPIQIAAARAIRKGGKADADRVSQLAAEASRADDDDEDEADFNEISDPLFGGGMDVSEVGDEEEEDEYAEDAVTEATDTTAETAAPTAATSSSSGAANPVIFRDYDIRGDAQLHLTDEVAYAIGQAVGSEAQARGQTKLAVAADGRVSSPRLKEQLINGLISTGAHVVDIGNVPSPVLYFVTETTEINSGVIVTASHNPASDNGFKVVLNGETLADDAIQTLRNRIDTGNFSKGEGSQTSSDYSTAYMEQIAGDIALADNLKVVIDCGNGIASDIAPKLFEELGCEVVPLFCEVDGNFPNHPPDPSVEENLKWLVDKVTAESADIGIALDGDGDRMVAVSPSGKVVMPDRLLMLFAKDIVSRNPGTDIIFDVKCTRRLNNLISGYGGRPLMWKSGHAHIKSKMKETGAMLGGELSGHMFFKERWYGFDDGLYAAARLLEILTIRDQSLDAALSSLPVSAITPEIRVPVAEEEKFAAIDKLIKQGDFSGGKMTTIDGLRVDFAKGWGLIRASNTGPNLTMRFEGDNDEVLEKIRQLFKSQIDALLPELNITF